MPNQFDRQNKIDFEPTAPKQENQEGRIDTEKTIEQLINPEQNKASLEKQEQVIVEKENKSEELPKEIDIAKKIKDYCSKRDFSEKQESILTGAIKLVIQGRNSNYEKAEKIIEEEDDALLDAFHDLIEDNPEIRKVVEEITRED